MTKHELLDRMYDSVKVIEKDLADEFDVSQSYVSAALIRCKKQGLVKFLGRNKGKKVFCLTEKGVDRLRYLDDNCTNEKCSCRG